MTTTTRDRPMRQTLRNPSEATRLRHQLVEQLQCLGFEQGALDAGVMVSELITNAIEHGHSPAVVSVEVIDEEARVAVHDDGGGVPVVRPRDPYRVGGNGLRVVDAFAHEWGVDRETVGKTVWFTVTRSEVTPRPGAAATPPRR